MKKYVYILIFLLTMGIVFSYADYTTWVFDWGNLTFNGSGMYGTNTSWSQIRGIPDGFADGVDNTGAVAEGSPVNATNLNASGQVMFTGLLDCDVLNTSAEGILQCDTDGGGGGGYTSGDLNISVLQDNDGTLSINNTWWYTNFFQRGTVDNGDWCRYVSASNTIECDVTPVSDSTCDSSTCDVTNTGTLDGYEAADLLDDTNETTNVLNILNYYIQGNRTLFSNSSNITIDYNGSHYTFHYNGSIGSGSSNTSQTIRINTINDTLGLVLSDYIPNNDTSNTTQDIANVCFNGTSYTKLEVDTEAEVEAIWGISIVSMTELSSLSFYSAENVSELGCYNDELNISSIINRSVLDLGNATYVKLGENDNITDTNCTGGSCDIANTGTLDGYEGATLALTNTSKDMQNAVNVSQLYQLLVDCDNIIFDTGQGSASICDGVDATGGGGGSSIFWVEGNWIYSNASAGGTQYMSLANFNATNYNGTNYYGSAFYDDGVLLQTTVNCTADGSCDLITYDSELSYTVNCTADGSCDLITYDSELSYTTNCTADGSCDLITYDSELAYIGNCTVDGSCPLITYDSELSYTTNCTADGSCDLITYDSELAYTTNCTADGSCSLITYDSELSYNTTDDMNNAVNNTCKTFGGLNICGNCISITGGGRTCYYT